MFPEQQENQFVNQLKEQLMELYKRLLELFKEIDLQTQEYIDEFGRKANVTTLNPTLEQTIVSNSIHDEYMKWARIVVTFVSKKSEKAAAEFYEVAELFSTYILLHRSGTNISDKLWRSLFEKESGQILLGQIRFLDNFQDVFNILKPRTLPQYNEFALKFRKIDSGKFLAEARCNLGEAEKEFSLPFDDKELENFILRHCQPRRAVTRSWTPDTLRPISDFGKRLFDTVISDSVRDLFFTALQDTRTQEKGLRIKLSYNNAPNLGNVPWEMMFDGRDFLSLSNASPITRYVDTTNPTRTLKVEAPLRILVTASSPTGLQQLEIEEERRQLETVLTPLAILGYVKVDFTPDGSLQTLQRMLRQAESLGEPYHIWHYIGHGKYDSNKHSSALIFEGENNQPEPATGFELGTLFNSYPSLRLAVLNACEGARSSKEDILSSVASGLVERGLAVVIAMQFEITDKAAIVFSEELYASVIDGLPIDSALTEARRSIFFLPNHVEWITPVLFMRVEDGKIFDVYLKKEEAS